MVFKRSVTLASALEYHLATHTSGSLFTLKLTFGNLLCGTVSFDWETLKSIEPPGLRAWNQAAARQSSLSTRIPFDLQCLSAPSDPQAHRRRKLARGRFGPELQDIGDQTCGDRSISH